MDRPERLDRSRSGAAPSPGSSDAENVVHSEEEERARYLPGGTTVLNDVHLGQRIMLLTGANMSGKSTLMRSVMAVALLGNVGLPVPCTHATVPQVRLLWLYSLSACASC